MEYRQTNNSHTRGARVHAYAVRGLLRPLRWGYASLLVLELCFTVRADRRRCQKQWLSECPKSEKMPRDCARPSAARWKEKSAPRCCVPVE